MPIENELKFVLLESEVVEQAIAAQAEQVLRIEQKYLSLDKDLSVRIRLTINNGVHSHRLTVKKNIHKKVIEIETPISTDDFEALWPTGRNKVVKLRYLYQGWEIDFLKDISFSNYISIAEIEMHPWQEAPDEIPELIKNFIIYEVPITDKRFSNRKLGNIKYTTKLLDGIKKNSNAHLVNQMALISSKKKIK
jgi:CYTH domain-containing protein